MKLWDYSDLFGNVKGWIAPEISLFWGVSILILVKFVQPTVMAVINRLNGWFGFYHDSGFDLDSYGYCEISTSSSNG